MRSPCCLWDIWAFESIDRYSRNRYWFYTIGFGMSITLWTYIKEVFGSNPALTGVSLKSLLSLLSSPIPCALYNIYIYILIRIVAAESNWVHLALRPTPGDYDDGEIGGMMIGRANRSTRKEPAPVPLCPPRTPHVLPGSEPWPPRWEASE
jgi:hypothetical protein